DKAAPRGAQMIICQAPTLDELSVRDVWQAVQMLGAIPGRDKVAQT
ncbi:MAG TPA: lipopolysaccharide heptosyltransferase family protein, partial [Henriciella marina]|nr:lipopolysaccharide heptosyltransferase family protein [Henriciella marina]